MSERGRGRERSEVGGRERERAREIERRIERAREIEGGESESQGVGEEVRASERVGGKRGRDTGRERASVRWRGNFY